MVTLLLSPTWQAVRPTTQGFSGVITSQGSYIPASNFKTAGQYVWNNASYDIPEQMRKIEQDFKEANTFLMALHSSGICLGIWW